MMKFGHWVSITVNSDVAAKGKFSRFSHTMELHDSQGPYVVSAAGGQTHSFWTGNINTKCLVSVNNERAATLTF